MPAARPLPVLLLALLLASAVHAGDAGVLYVNARMFTADPARPYAEALAVRGERIVGVGSRAEAAGALGPGARQIDLKGRFLMPGLVDAHCHAVYGGLGLIGADNEDRARTVEELSAFAEDARRSGRGLQGEVLVVEGVALSMWTQLAALAARFDRGDYARQPLLLRGMDGHTAWANRALRERAGIDRALLDRVDAAERALIGTDAAGEPDGRLAEAAIARVDAVIPPPDAARLLEGARAGARHLHGFGITAWLDPSVTARELAAYRALDAAGELQAQVVALPVIDFRKADPDAQLRTALALREEYAGTPGLRVGGIKVFADGVAEYPSQTAHLSHPYRNSGRNGELLFAPADFARIATAADRAGLIVHVHAIGDQAVTAALDGIAAARAANGDSGLPHTLTHMQFVRPDDIARLRPLGVVSAFQLYWARGSDTTIDLMKPYVDPAIYAWQYPARAVLDAGGLVAGASDWNVSTPDVFAAIYRAETRNGPKGVLDPAQRVPREAMLYAYTRNAARALGAADRLGSLAKGLRADFVVLDRDVLTASAEEARDTRVLWTVVGGAGVYGAAP